MNLLLTGATGMAGSYVLRQALEDPEVHGVTALTRKPLPVTHPKLKAIVHSDFLHYGPIAPSLAGHDACLWCLGISQTQVTKDEYHKITYDYTLAGARAMLAANARFTFCFLSGQGADSAEKSRVLFARIKGKTENALNTLGIPSVYHFRPGYIHPPKPREQKTWEDHFVRPLAPLMYLFFPGLIVSAVDLSRAMIEVAKKGTGQSILENRRIKEIAGA